MFGVTVCHADAKVRTYSTIYSTGRMPLKQLKKVFMCNLGIVLLQVQARQIKCTLVSDVICFHIHCVALWSRSRQWSRQRALQMFAESLFSFTQTKNIHFHQMPGNLFERYYLFLILSPLWCLEFVTASTGSNGLSRVRTMSKHVPAHDVINTVNTCLRSGVIVWYVFSTVTFVLHLICISTVLWTFEPNNPICHELV